MGNCVDCKSDISVIKESLWCLIYWIFMLGMKSKLIEYESLYLYFVRHFPLSERQLNVHLVQTASILLFFFSVQPCWLLTICLYCAWLNFLTRHEVYIGFCASWIWLSLIILFVIVKQYAIQWYQLFFHFVSCPIILSLILLFFLLICVLDLS